jgi:hypothetical protein
VKSEGRALHRQQPCEGSVSRHDRAGGSGRQPHYIISYPRPSHATHTALTWLVLEARPITALGWLLRIVNFQSAVGQLNSAATIPISRPHTCQTDTETAT